MDALIETLKNHDLPFKVLVQDVKYIRSIDFNAYLFGVVYRMIADETGYSVDEVHEYLALKFRIKYYFNPKLKQMVFERTSTTLDSAKDLDDYIEKVCAWALDFLKLLIPAPNEVIHNEQFNEVKL